MMRVVVVVNVSIHAPARGATPAEDAQKFWDDVSIHAPARGATGKFFAVKNDAQRFNPRAREGRDWLRTN